MISHSRSAALARAAVAMGLAAALASFSPPASASGTPGGTLTAPACTDQAATAPLLAGITPSTVAVPGEPFGVAVLPGGRYAVAAVDLPTGSVLALLSLHAGALQLLRTVPLPGPIGGTGLPAGLAVSHNGRYLAVAENEIGTALISLPELLAGSSDPILGEFTDGRNGVIEVTFSADDGYLFVSDEYTSALSVFSVARALRDGFSAPGVAVGQLPLGPDPVGSALSPDGRYLYVTSEVASADDFAHGVLQVIEVAKAERDPAHSLVAAVNAGCQPVRVTLSDHGSLAWVTARGSDALLTFDTADLRTHPAAALRADVLVGPAPVGVVLADRGRYALVADSARYTTPGSPQTVSVVDTRAALSGRPALVGAVQAGAFPRDLAYDQDTGEAVLSNYGSNTVEAFRFPG